MRQLLYKPLVTMENCKEESAHKVAKRNATKTALKPRLSIASSTKVPPNLKQTESVKLKGSVKKGKQEPRDHHQAQHSPNSLYLQPTV